MRAHREHVPCIKLSNLTTGGCSSMYKPDNMDERCFPDAELELVHEVHNKHSIRVKTEWCKFLGKCILIQSPDVRVAGTRHK